MPTPTEQDNSPAGRAARWAAAGGQDAFGDEPEDLVAGDTGNDLFTDESGVLSDPDDDAWVTAAPEPAVLVPHAPPVFPVWGFLPEARETAQLAQLRQWVLFAVQRYELDGIRPCWAQHGPALEALTALHTRWLEIYLRPGWGGDAEGQLDAQSNRGYDALVFLEQLDTRCDRLAKGTFYHCGSRHTPTVPDERWAGDLPEFIGQIARTDAPPVAG